MRASISIGGAASGRKSDWDALVSYVQEAEKLGVDSVWSAEAWGQDAVTPLAFMAGQTSTIRLGSGIMQISARAPAMTAMTAMTLDSMSGGRFICGLGVSGPQVVEGLHGVSFDAPLARLRDTIAVLRLAFTGEKIVHESKTLTLPKPGGQGKALRLAQPATERIPIHLATLAPGALRLTGELADGWVGTSFTPEGADAHLDHLREGAASAGRTLDDIEIQVPVGVEFGDRGELIPKRKPGTAFSLGAMGSATTNYYSDAYSRGGWAEDAERVRGLWVEGKRDEAAAAVPDEMIIRTNLLGSDDEVSDRLRAYRDAGVDLMRLDPQGETVDERLAVLGRTVELMKEISNEGASP